MPVINITRHKTTEQQNTISGVIDIPDQFLEPIKELSIFQPLPTLKLLKQRAKAIVDIIDGLSISNITGVLCGGAPYFNAVLDRELISRGYTPCYPFTMKVFTEYEDSKGNTLAGVEHVHVGLVKTYEESL